MWKIFNLCILSIYSVMFFFVDGKKEVKFVFVELVFGKYIV